MKEISAGIIIYRKTKEGMKFLLLYHGGNYWNFPKGHIEQTENAYRAAFREVKEETGLPMNALLLQTYFRAYERYMFTKHKQRILKTVVYFLAETREPRIRVSHEHSGYGWFLYRDALRMLPYKNSREHLKRANDFINQRNVLKVKVPESFIKK